MNYSQLQELNYQIECIDGWNISESDKKELTDKFIDRFKYFNAVIEEQHGYRRT